MNSILKKAGFCIAMSVALASAAFADLAPDFMEKLTADSRPQEDKVRDGARRPYQVMQLLGVDAGMTAVDVGAAGGWFTRVLSAAVGPEGKVIAQFGPRALEQNNGQAAKDLAASLGNVEPAFVATGEIGSNVADVAVTALNIHHANDERGIAAMKELFTVLKPGGMAVVIDHVGSPGSNNARLHRMLPESAKAWIEAAGFEIVQESDILRTTADDHTMSVDAPELGRDIDQFLFLVRKPL
jgi:predicted methyltransferase